MTASSIANFYSDTQTRPSRAMRETVLEAAVGDEQRDDDPTTQSLCERVADLLGKEAAIFLPSGSMCNEIAIAAHCRPGDEVICERMSHIIIAEGGGPAALSGVMVHPIDGDRGAMTPQQVEDAIRVPPSRYAPRSRLLSVEQTANLAGGAVWPVEALASAAAPAREAGLATHMDGARLMNAVVASGVEAKQHAAAYDTVWLDFTKGLGCPVGAAMAGSREFIEAAWAFKQRWGGAMRQSGILAAMCHYALDHNVDRLAEDHALAKTLAGRLANLPLVAGVIEPDTNIVMVDLVDTGPDGEAAAAQLKAAGVWVSVMGKRRLRVVTHMDVNAAAGDVLIDAVAGLA